MNPWLSSDGSFTIDSLFIFLILSTSFSFLSCPFPTWKRLRDRKRREVDNEWQILNMRFLQVLLRLAYDRSGRKRYWLKSLTFFHLHFPFHLVLVFHLWKMQSKEVYEWFTFPFHGSLIAAAEQSSRRKKWMMQPQRPDGNGFSILITGPYLGLIMKVKEVQA